MWIEEGQELRRKDMPNVRILVCHIKGRFAGCACDDGCFRYIKLKTLHEYYEHVPEPEEEVSDAGS